MTMIGELPGNTIALNPDVPYPPFPISVAVPASWSALDCAPTTWRRSAEDLIDTTFRGARLPASDRRGIVTFLEGVVADCQRAGAALSLVTVGRLAGGGAASFGLHLAFASDDRPATLGRVHDMLPRTGTITELATSSGPALLHRDRVTMVVPGTAAIAALTSLQVFLPIVNSTWTVVLSTASAHPDLTDALESLIRASAASIRTGRHRGDGASGDEGSDDEGSDDDASGDEGRGDHASDDDASGDEGTTGDADAAALGSRRPSADLVHRSRLLDGDVTALVRRALDPPVTPGSGSSGSGS